MAENIGYQFRRTFGNSLEEFAVVGTINERNDTPSGVRYDGMEVYVISEQTKYRLQGGLTDDFWQDLGSQILETSDDLPEGIQNLYLQVSERLKLEFISITRGIDLDKIVLDDSLGVYVGNTDGADSFLANGQNGNVRNTIIGNNAFRDSVGVDNTVIGHNSGREMIEESRVTLVGANIIPDGSTEIGVTNSTAIGYGAPLFNNNQVSLGNEDVTSVLIGSDLEIDKDQIVENTNGLLSTEINIFGIKTVVAKTPSFLRKFLKIPTSVSTRFDYLPFDISDFNDNEFYSKNLDLQKTFEDNNTITIGETYVDAIKGDDSNNGAVPNRPKKTIAAALALGSSKIYLKDGVYDPFQWRFDSPLSNRARIIIGVGENVYFKVIGDELNNFNAVSGLSTSTFQMQLVTDNRLFKILRKDLIDNDGEYTPIRKLASANDVNSTANAWHYDEDTKIVTVRLDAVEPHATGAENRAAWFNENIAPLLVPVYIPAAGNINFIRSYSNNLFLKNVNIEGLYVHGLKHPDHPKGSIYLENCTLKHSPTGGLIVDDTDYVIKDTYVTRSVNDNIGVHEFQPETKPDGMEINVKSTYAGDIDTNGDNIVPNKNGSSVHEDGNVIRIGGEYAYNFGPNVIDVCRNNADATGETYMLNVIAHSSLSDTSSEDFEAYQYRKMYMSNCKALKNGKVTVRSNAEIYYNNLIAETTEEFTNGTIQEYEF